MRVAPLLLCFFAAVASSTARSYAAEEDQLESSRIRVDDQLVTIYTYRGQSYRFIEPTAINEPALAGQLACIEGKLRELRGTSFSIYGTDCRFQATNADILRGTAPGDNLWIGGRVASGTLTAHVAVKLKTDLALFDERFAQAKKDKSWEHLLDLAAWISRSATFNPKIDFDEHRRYRASYDRAVTAACALAEETFANSDAAGYSYLALRLLDLDIDRERVWRYFQRAAQIDPDQELAIRRLSEAGYVRWHGRWLTPVARDEQQAEETQRAVHAAELRMARTQRRTEEAASGAAIYARDVAELESALAPLPAADAAIRLGSAIERASSSRIGRRILFLTATLPPTTQAQLLAEALASRDPEIRCSALELLSRCSDIKAQPSIASSAANDPSDEVVETACHLLASAGNAPSMAKLVSLTASERDFRARAAVQALQAVTGQDRWTAVEWRIWWEHNQSAYPARPTK